jgi:hypothetical protein
LRIGYNGEHVELSDRNRHELEKAEWSFMTCTSCQLLFGLQLKEGGLDGASCIHDKYTQRFGGKSSTTKQLGTPRNMWKYNSKMYLRQIKWDCKDWIHLAKGTEKWVP